MSGIAPAGLGPSFLQAIHIDLGVFRDQEFGSAFFFEVFIYGVCSKVDVQKSLFLCFPLWFCCVAPSAYAMTHAQGELLSAQARAGNASALQALKKGAQQGDKTAENWLGVYYGVRKEYSKAVFWSRKAALQGDPLAEFVMGEVYHYGNGVPKNDSTAIYWYKLAVAQGYEGAQPMLTRLEKQMTEQKPAPHTVSKSAATHNVIPTKPAVPAAPLPAVLTAQQQNRLGYAYYSGQGQPKNYAKAVYWYRKAAAQGNASAENNLGVAYNYGHGVRKNYTRAVYWYRKAADQGNPSAETNLGVVYYQGNGVKSSTMEALHWWTKAAGQGDQRAQSYLNVVKLTTSGGSDSKG